MGDRKDALEMVRQMRCGGKKFPSGGKFFRTNLQNESPLMYQPILPSVPDVPTPMRYRPQPHLGLYEYPSTTGMAESYPVTLPSRAPVTVSRSVSAPVMVEAPVENLFSDEAIARRALKQRYAESAFNDKAKSNAGAQGAWQIMPITLKDYLGRGRGKAGDLNDPAYNRKVRDWVMGIIPRDLQEFWSDSDSDRAKLAKLYAAYNWGAGNLRSFLRKKRDAGVDISNPDNWVDDLNPETRRYVKYLAFDEDIPDSTVYTNAAFENAAAERGYASGGKIRIKPENRGKFTALLKRTGKSASWFKKHGTPLQRKRATFALNARKWKHGDGGSLDNYFFDGGPYGVIPLGGDYLTYLQTMPEVSGGLIDPAIVTAPLPAKFNGSQAAAARYAEGYQKGAKPVSEAMNRAGQDIFRAADTVAGFIPGPVGMIDWLGHMGADAVEGNWGKVGRDIALATALGAGARGISLLKNYVDDATNFGEDVFRAFTDGVPGRVSTNFTYAAPATMETMEAVPAVSNAAPAPYEIENLGGGYMLKSLMRGNPLEKQISKNGTVNVNNVRALIGKGSKVEQAVVDKVLASEEFAGKKSIDYNKFRKAVQNELITYERKPDTRFKDYGLDRIGYPPSQFSTNIRAGEMFNEWANRNYENIGYLSDDILPSYRDKNTGEIVSWSDLQKKYQSFVPGSETYTFSSPRIPNGSAKHYHANTLGHSRTYTTADEPDVLHVMESQSDWGQGYKKMNLDGEYNQKRINSLERRINNLKESINSEMEGLRTEKMNDGSDMSPWFADSLRKQIEKDKQLLEELTVELDMRRNPKSATQQDYLAENFTSRQIQENLRYAAEKGQTKMRYPTRETAAKIEGYPEREAYFDASGRDITADGPVYTYGDDVDKRIAEINKRIDQLESNPGGDAEMNEYTSLIGERMRLLQGEAKLKPGVTKKTVYDYEDILRKYTEFPKQYKKLYKNADVRIVTDPKGNTWYEVNVPENYLQKEWAYEEGGSMILPKMMMDKHSPDKLKKAIARLKANKFEDGGDKKPKSEVVELRDELTPSVVKAYEPLYIDTPYSSSSDFFQRWYPSRRNQMIENMAQHGMVLWPSQKRAEKSVDAYTRSMLENNGQVKQFIAAIPGLWDWSSAVFPNAMKNEAARKVLSDHRAYDYAVVGKEVPKDGFDDWDLAYELIDSYGMSYKDEPHYVFYDRPNPSFGTQVHEMTHTLQPTESDSNGALKKYRPKGILSGYRNPMETKVDAIQADMLDYNGFRPMIGKPVSYPERIYTEDMLGKDSSGFRYYSSPEEIVARLNAIRASQGINPKHTITLDDLKQIREKASNLDKEGFLDLFTDEALLRFFNEVASLDSEVNWSNMAKCGGFIRPFRN